MNMYFVMDFQWMYYVKLVFCLKKPSKRHAPHVRHCVSDNSPYCSFFWVDPGAMVRKVANSYVIRKRQNSRKVDMYIVQCTLYNEHPLPQPPPPPN